jgi:hypothetical protein
MQKKFHVVSNIMHDNAVLARGSTLVLDEASKEARSLLAAGAIQAEPLDVEPQDTAPEPQEEPKQPQVGGDASKTGEPSLDDPEPTAPDKDAQDVTPEVSEKMTRDELEKLAIEKGFDPDEVKEAPNKATLVDLITGEITPELEPEVDPSANL